jgi:hypothetical protein
MSVGPLRVALVPDGGAGKAHPPGEEWGCRAEVAARRGRRPADPFATQGRTSGVGCRHRVCCAVCGLLQTSRSAGECRASGGCVGPLPEGSRTSAVRVTLGHSGPRPPAAPSGCSCGAACQWPEGSHGQGSDGDGVVRTPTWKCQLCSPSYATYGVASKLSLSIQAFLTGSIYSVVAYDVTLDGLDPFGELAGVVVQSAGLRSHQFAVGPACARVWISYPSAESHAKFRKLCASYLFWSGASI